MSEQIVGRVVFGDGRVGTIKTDVKHHLDLIAELKLHNEMKAALRAMAEAWETFNACIICNGAGRIERYGVRIRECDCKKALDAACSAAAKFSKKDGNGKT